MENNNFIKFLEKLNIKPKNINVFLESITHPSYTNENKECKSYQRLEFLGDSLLNKFAAELIFNLYKNKNEGEMTILRSRAVSGEKLSENTVNLGLNKFIRFGNNSKELHKNKKILADIFESFIAAVYLDLGKEKMNEILEITVFSFIKNNYNKELKNPKTIIQEILQAGNRDSVEYKTEQEDEIFITKLIHEKIIYGIGSGKTKKESEINAAKKALLKCSEEKGKNV